MAAQKDEIYDGNVVSNVYDGKVVSGIYDGNVVSNVYDGTLVRPNTVKTTMTGNELSNAFDPVTPKELYNKLEKIFDAQDAYNRNVSSQIAYISKASLDKIRELSQPKIDAIDLLVDKLYSISIDDMFTLPEHTRTIMQINSIIQSKGGKKRRTRRKRAKRRTRR
jgi:hypothetical protein